MTHLLSNKFGRFGLKPYRAHTHAYMYAHSLENERPSDRRNRNMVLNSQFEISSKPLLTVDEVENVQRQRVVSLTSHVFQLTLSGMFDTLISEENVKHCNGCATNHPSQRQHSCLMMDCEDAWMHYHNDAQEKIHLTMLLKTAESVCNTLGFKLGKSWNAYVTELPRFPRTSIYLTSLELSQGKDLESRILYALYYGPSGLKSKDYDWGVQTDPCEVECPELVFKKEEKPMDLDLVINDIQNKLCM